MAFRIMVVESDPVYADLVRAALQTAVLIDPSAEPYLDGRLELDVEVLSDGELALQIAKSNPPDLIVLCVELPKMSGYSICNKIKKKPEIKGIPLIIMSSGATPEIFEQHKRLKTRAEDYLIKPFPMDELVAKVAFLLGLSLESEFSDHTSPDGVQKLSIDLGSELAHEDTNTGVEYSYDDEGAEVFSTDSEVDDEEYIEPVEEDEDAIGRTMIDNDINLATDLAFAALEIPDLEQQVAPPRAAEALLVPETTEEADIAIELDSVQAGLDDEVVLEDQQGEPELIGIEPEATLDEEPELIGIEPEATLDEKPEPIGVEPAMTMLEQEPSPAGEEEPQSYRETSLLEPEQAVGAPGEEQEPELVPEAGTMTSVGTELAAAQRPSSAAALDSFARVEEPQGELLDELQQRMSELERENRHLNDELQNARARVREAGGGFSRDRELLSLREVINRKEKEILDLKDDLDSKERQILDHKDKVRELERKVRDMDEKLLGIEREIVTVQERSEALHADKLKLQEREAQVKARLEEAKKEIDKAYVEIDSLKQRQVQERKDHEAERAAQAQAAEQARQELEQRLSGELDATRLAHAQETEQLRQRHQAALQEQEAQGRAELDRVQQQHAQVLAEAEQKQAEELEQLRISHEQAMEGARQEQQAELERAQQRYAQQLQQRITELIEERERALEALRSENRAQQAQLEAEHAGKLRELTERKAQELEQREAEHAGELERLRSEQQAELARRGQEHEGALEGLRREHSQQLEELVQEQQVEVKELEGRIAATEQRSYELAQQLEDVQKKLQDVEHQRSSLSDELQSTRELVSQRDQQLLEYEQQVADYQEQIIRAYNKIRADEQLAEKARRAMAIAVTLLDEQKRITGEDKEQSAS